MAPVKSSKVRRSELINKLEVTYARQGNALTPDKREQIRLMALESIRPTVEEAPDGFYNKFNTNQLLSLATLVASGITLEGQAADLWAGAITKGIVNVVEDPDDPTWRTGDLVVNGTHVVRQGVQYTHVFRKGAEREGNSIERMLNDL